MIFVVVVVVVVVNSPSSKRRSGERALTCEGCCGGDFTRRLENRPSKSGDLCRLILAKSHSSGGQVEEVGGWGWRGVFDCDGEPLDRTKQPNQMR